jgi:antitoxin component of RelBE/YafQ-DinJ toxin-antitoxin module
MRPKRNDELNKTKQLNFRLSKEQLEQLKHIAKTNNVTVSNLMGLLVTSLIQKQSLDV